MFGSLKKKLKEGIAKLTKKVEEPEQDEPKQEEKQIERAPAAEAVEQALPELEKELEPRPEKEEKKEAEEEIKVEKGSGKETSEESKTVERPGILDEMPEPLSQPEEPKVEKKGFFGRLKARVSEKTLKPEEIDEFFDSIETGLMEADVAVEVIDYMRSSLKDKLTFDPIKRSHAKESIARAFEEALLETVNYGQVDIPSLAAKKKPFTIVFVGFNGSGKTTSLAKSASWLQKRGLSVVFAAGDTFRAASIEQLEHHGEKLGVKTIKHKYGSDSAAVIFDAKKHAEARGIDIVLADTAGRTHADSNLMDELHKIIKVNSPDLIVLVVDSLTGNDAVEQAKRFDEAVGVDAVVMTKVDVNQKGGSILSVCYAIKKPILFIGVGQGYGDFKLFDPEGFVKQLLE